jgi:hypothetical protein
MLTNITNPLLNKLHKIFIVLMNRTETSISEGWVSYHYSVIDKECDDLGTV